MVGALEFVYADYQRLCGRNNAIVAPPSPFLKHSKFGEESQQKHLSTIAYYFATFIFDILVTRRSFRSRFTEHR